MPVYSFQIGTTYANLTNLESLLSDTSKVRAPRSQFYQASTFIERADGSIVGRGYPYCRWIFDTMDDDFLTALRTYCSGYSANIYIRTRIQDETFKAYSCVMQWPSKEQMERRAGVGDSGNAIYRDLEFLFKRMVYYADP